MKVIQNLVPASKYNTKCPYTMQAEAIVVHNTANDATAANEVAYMIRNDNQVSFHYAIDDKEIVQGIPENRNAWHAGDGGNGPGNRKGLSIEICYSKTGGPKFIEAEKLAAKFIAFKLKEKGWGIERVKTHQMYSKKYCPRRTLDMGWQRFINMIQDEMKEPTKPAQGKYPPDLSPWAQGGYDFVIKNNLSDGQRPKAPVTREELWIIIERLNSIKS